MCRLPLISRFISSALCNRVQQHYAPIIFNNIETNHPIIDLRKYFMEKFFFNAWAALKSISFGVSMLSVFLIIDSLLTYDCAYRSLTDSCHCMFRSYMGFLLSKISAADFKILGENVHSMSSCSSFYVYVSGPFVIFLVEQFKLEVLALADKRRDVSEISGLKVYFFLNSSSNFKCKYSYFSCLCFKKFIPD